LADAAMFIAIASLLSVFDIKKGDGTAEGPDAYPYTGNGLRYGFRIHYWHRRPGGADRLAFTSLIVHALSRAPSPQGIEGQKSLSWDIPKLHDLLSISKMKRARATSVPRMLSLVTLVSLVLSLILLVKSSRAGRQIYF
jgi:hypothetical protein